MNEKIYKAMGSSAVSSLVIGICVLATGIAAGVLLIINGSRLLKHKSKFIIILQIRRIFHSPGFYSLLSTCLLVIVDISFFHAKVNAYC